MLRLTWKIGSLGAFLVLTGCYADTSGAGIGASLGADDATRQASTDPASALPPDRTTPAQADSTSPGSEGGGGDPAVEPPSAGGLTEQDAGAGSGPGTPPGEEDGGSNDPIEPPTGSFPPGSGPPTPTRIGDPCRQDGDCSALLNGFRFAEGICLTEDEGFPGGSCSATCNAPDFFCDDGASCVEGACQPTCERDSDCREPDGYECTRMFFSAAPDTCQPT